ncbi:outer membrane protein OmpU [Roseinatronobacter monicus]|uniref:Outer membrane protein OmpU n=2 Tax=Roseinatronobacter monicus TaxID=393481 RepID=A0A543KGT0_9RHOB|nr:outer membrane protein OmpU [Roseinatronobacter monicus]
MASAQGVSLSGDGRMGLIYDGDDIRFTSRARVTFTLSGETDSGLAFGGSFRADNASNAASGSAGNVFISGDFGRLAMGDVDGAALAAVGDLYSVGLTTLGDAHEMNYIGRLLGDTINDEDDGVAQFSGVSIPSLFPRALYSYSIDGFSFYASVSNPVTVRVNNATAFNTQTGLATSNGDSLGTITEFGVGASYSIDGFTGALGYERARANPASVTGLDSITFGHLAASAEYSMDGISVKAIVGRAMNDLKEIIEDEDGSKTQYGLGVSGTFDATTVTAFGRRDFAKDRYLGLGASYDLGGGASIKGGVVHVSPNVGSSETRADFGLAFTF